MTDNDIHSLFLCAYECLTVDRDVDDETREKKREADDDLVSTHSSTLPLAPLLLFLSHSIHWQTDFDEKKTLNSQNTQKEKKNTDKEIVCKKDIHCKERIPIQFDHCSFHAFPFLFMGPFDISTCVFNEESTSRYLLFYLEKCIQSVIE